MSPKTLTLILSLAATLAGGVAGACVALAISPAGRQPAAQVEANQINASPAEALDPAALARKKASRLEEIQHDISACWADLNTEPAKLYAYVSKLPEDDLEAILHDSSPSDSAGAAKNLALHFLFKRDPGAATQFVMAKLTASKGDNTLPDEQTSSALEEWVTADPTHALQWATSQPSNDHSKQLLFDALSVYGGNDPWSAFQAMATMKFDDDQEKQLAFMFTAHQAAEFDLPDVLAAAQSLPPGNDRSAAIGFVLLRGATVDPKTVLNLALQSPLTQDRANFETLHEVARQIGEDDPELVLATAKNIADPKLRAVLVAGAMPALTQQDPQSAWSFATTQLAGPDQLSAVGVVAHDASRNNPDMVASWITQMPGGPAKNRACEMLLAQWSDQEPDRAAAWVQQLPDDRNKMFQISRVISHWALQDPTASAQWLDSLPTGKARDNANTTYAWQMVSSQPSVAFDRAASISDPALQQRVLGYLYKREISTDAQAARDWLQKSNLPDDEKQKIIDQGSK